MIKSNRIIDAQVSGIGEVTVQFSLAIKSLISSRSHKIAKVILLHVDIDSTDSYLKGSFMAGIDNIRSGVFVKHNESNPCSF